LRQTIIALLLVLRTVTLFSQNNAIAPLQFCSDLSEPETESLSELIENPIDLNAATKEDIDAMPFLSPFQKASLWQYLVRNRPVVSLFELQYIVGFTRQDAILLAQFCTAGSCLPKYTNNRLHHSVYSGYSYRQSSAPDESLNFFEDSKRIIKYKAKNKSVSLGITTEQDAGEPINSKYSTMPDYTSAYFGIVQDSYSVYAGDYELRWAQGLVAWQGYSFSKPMLYTDARKYSRPIKEHTSSEENRFCRGIAATKKFQNIHVTTIASSVQQDGNLFGDTIAMSNSGLHRTHAELEKKDNLNHIALGVQTELYLQRLKFGIRHLHHNISQARSPHSNQYHNSSADAIYSTNIAIFFCEFAVDKNCKFAYISGLQFSPDPQIDLCILYRNYQAEYNAVSAQSFAEYSGTQNERGIYCGATWQTSSVLNFGGSYDLYASPAPRYRSPFPSFGSELKISSTYTPMEDITVTPKISNQKKKRPFTDNKSKTTTESKWIYCLLLKYTPHNFSMATGIMYSTFSSKNENDSGSLLYWQINFLANKKISICYQIASFRTIYTTQLYLYDPNVLRTISTPAYNGNGTRNSILALYNTKRLRLGVKYAKTATSKESNNQFIAKNEWTASCTIDL